MNTGIDDTKTKRIRGTLGTTLNYLGTLTKSSNNEECGLSRGFVSPCLTVHYEDGENIVYLSTSNGMYIKVLRRSSQITSKEETFIPWYRNRKESNVGRCGYSVKEIKSSFGTYPYNNKRKSLLVQFYTALGIGSRDTIVYHLNSKLRSRKSELWSTRKTDFGSPYMKNERRLDGIYLY